MSTRAIALSSIALLVVLVAAAYILRRDPIARPAPDAAPGEVARPAPDAVPAEIPAAVRDGIPEAKPSDGGEWEFASYRRISPGRVARSLEEGRGVLLDVRTREEYDRERIPGSVLVPLADIEVFGPAVEAAIPDKGETVFLMCRSGRRSHTALLMMEKLGYGSLYNMGGIIDWEGRVESGTRMDNRQR